MANTISSQSVIGSFATLNEQNEVIAFDFNSFDTLVSELVTERAKLRKENADAIKEQKKANADALAEVGKAYYNSLKVGDIFEVILGGKNTKVRKIETKSGSGSSAACELVVSAGGKTDRRYPKFDKVVVPQTEESSDEAVADAE